jgi:hypothetical protein
MTFANGCRDDGLAPFRDSCSHVRTSDRIVQDKKAIYKSITYSVLQWQQVGKKKANR